MKHSIGEILYWFKWFFVLRHKQAKKQKILKKLLSTTEGRQKLAEAMKEPMKDAVEKRPSPIVKDLRYKLTMDENEK